MMQYVLNRVSVTQMAVVSSTVLKLAPFIQELLKGLFPFVPIAKSCNTLQSAQYICYIIYRLPDNFRIFCKKVQCHH